MLLSLFAVHVCTFYAQIATAYHTSQDVQNLSNKFKGPETSNLQRAMQW